MEDRRRSFFDFLFGGFLLRAIPAVNFTRRFERFSNGFTPSALEDNILRIWLRGRWGEDVEKISEDPRKGTAGMAP